MPASSAWKSASNSSWRCSRSHTNSLARLIRLITSRSSREQATGGCHTPGRTLLPPTDPAGHPPSRGRRQPTRSGYPSGSLGADYARLGQEVAELEAAGVDRIQWDIMDGRFVPNLSFSADVVAACRPHATLPYEAHLMVEDPDPWLQPFAAAGCDTVLVHAEASRHLHRTLSRIRDLGVRSGVALNPATPLESVQHVLDLVDVLLVMTVNPGFGGQAY